MGRKAPVSTRTMFRFVAMSAAAALVAVACGGGGTEGAVDPTGVSPSSTGIQTPSRDSADPCSAPLPTDGFALGTAADIPTVGPDGSISTLGSEEAAAILDQLILEDDSMCALDVSPGVQAAIDAVRAAAAQGDRSEVRRLLEQLIRVDLQAAASPIKSLRYSYAPEDRQKSRDSIAAAAEAQAQGENDLGDEAMEQAREHYTNYAETAIPATDDVKALLTIAAEAQLLGLDDIAFDAMEKAKDILEMELEAVADRYEPCTADREEFRELALATAHVQLIGGDSSSGDVLITKSINISIDRANGVPVPECEGQVWSLAMTLDVAEVTFLWDGVFSVSGGEIAGDGIGTLLGSGECVEQGVTIDVFEVTGMFTFGVTGTQTLRDGAEWLTLRVDATEADVELGAEDPRCVAFGELARSFFSLVPPLPGQYYPQGFEIQVADGIGFTDLAMDPYILEVDVALLDE